VLRDHDFVSSKVVPFLFQTGRGDLSLPVRIEESLEQHGGSMSSSVPQRPLTRSSKAGIAPFLTTLGIATALLTVWAGLCAI
jgi:hypothetical protein